MNNHTVREMLHLYLHQGKINFYQLNCIRREINQEKLMKDLTPQERELLTKIMSEK